MNQIAKAMNLLDIKRQREVIYYMYYEGLSQRKISKIMGISQPMVSREHKSAIEIIRKKSR
jgi:RNA polymerase sigma factor (sigma-70 family)